MLPGRLILAGEKAGGGTVDYAWFIWKIDYQGKPQVAWLRRDAP
jgi:hypothetical protein